MNRTLAVSTTLALAAVAGTTLVVTARPQWWTDDKAIRVRAPGAPVREILWQPASPLPTTGPAADPRDEYEPRLSADGTLMVLARGRPGANADLFSSRWSPKGWSTPEPIAAVNTDKDELGPELSADGRRLYFYSDRPGSLGGYDLWVSTLTDNAWGAPINLGPSINTAWNEYGPALSPAGDALYFASNRLRPDEPAGTPETWTATVRERRTRHDYDLFVAKLAPDALTPTEPAAPLAALNTDADESSPAVSPAGDFLYFASDRAGGLGGYDLYRSRLAPDRTLARPESLGDAVNSPSNDLDPALASAGFRLTFSSDRPHPPKTPEAPSSPDSAPSPRSSAPSSPRYTLWTTDSREVFRDVGPLTMPTLGAFWPRLLMLLAALLPLLLLSRFLLGHAGWRSRLGRMSLLAQCLVLSLFLHAILASLLAVWKVGSGMLDALRTGGGTGTRVILSSAPATGSTGSLTTQIRGALTDGVMAIPELTTPTPPAPLAAPADPETGEAPLPALALAPAAPAPIDLPASRSPEAPAPTTPTPTPAAALAEPAALPASHAPAAAAPETPVTPPPLAMNTGSPPAPLAPSAVGAANPAPLPSLAPTNAALAADAPAPRHEPRPSQPRATATPAPTPAATPGAEPAASLPSAPRAPAPAAESAPNAAPALGASSDLPAPGPAMRTNLPTGPTAPLPALAAANNAGAPLAAPAAGTPGRDLPAAPAVHAPARPGPAAGSDAALPAPLTPAASPAAEEAPPGPAGLGSLPDAGPAAPVPGVPMEAATPGSGTTNLPAIAAPAGAPSGALEPEASGRPDSPTAHEPPASAPPAPSPAPGGDGLPIPKETFDQRRPESRQQILERMGGSVETERAVALALEWFKRHQNADGRWSSKHFDDACGQCSGAGEVDADVAATGLALLCYLGAGHTQAQEGPYRATVASALAWLLARQAPDGDLRGRETMYSQTVAAVALCEAYAMTRDPALAGPAQKAVDLVLRRTAAAAPDKRDTSVLGWLVFTVESARRAGLTIPADAFDRARAWLDETSDPRRTGLYAYGPGKPPSAPMTAEAMFVQQLLGRSRTEPRMDASARFVARELPAWDRAAPTHHWYYATLALFQHQGPAWESWNTALKRELLARQHAAGPDAGSWDPQDQWSRTIGRVYQTAVCTLSLEVYYRYRTAPTPPGPTPTDAPKQAPGPGTP